MAQGLYNHSTTTVQEDKEESEWAEPPAEGGRRTLFGANEQKLNRKWRKGYLKTQMSVYGNSIWT